MSAIYKNHAELEDIVNQGVLALMDCIEKYDITRGVQFDSYASIRVRGSIIDYIRQQDWVPRGVRKKSIDIENTYAELHNEFGREPTDEELKERTGMPLDEINKIRGEAQGFSVLSYEELLEDSVFSLKYENTSFKSPELELEDSEIKSMIASAIDELNEQEKTVVSLYYYEELKIKEIAFVMGLTESRISQIHSKALMKLKMRLGSYMNNGIGGKRR
jgi:RNA polymerase sigma factor for flagellar operon FliA